MEGQIPHSIPRFQDALGSWRPDFLIKEDQETEAGYPREVFCITEINARFCFNGFLHAAFGQQALLDIGIERLGLDGATDPAKVITADRSESRSYDANSTRSFKGYVAYFVPIVLCIFLKARNRV